MICTKRYARRPALVVIFGMVLGCSGTAAPANETQSDATTGEGAEAFSICTFFPFLCNGGGADAGADAGRADASSGGQPDAAPHDAGAIDASDAGSTADATSLADADASVEGGSAEAGLAEAGAGTTALRCICNNEYKDMPCGNTDCASGGALVAACSSFCGTNALSAAVCVPAAGICVNGASPPNASKPEPNLVACDCAGGSISFCRGDLSGTNCLDANRSAILRPICTTECATLGGLAAGAFTSCVINDATCVQSPQ